MTLGPSLWPSPASRALPFIFQAPSAVQFLVSMRILYYGHTDSIEGPGEQNNGHADSVGKVGEDVFGGCWVKERTTPLVSFKSKRCKGMFPVIYFRIILRIKTPRKRMSLARSSYISRPNHNPPVFLPPDMLRTWYLILY